jgi:hypothetical protein
MLAPHVKVKFLETRHLGVPQDIFSEFLAIDEILHDIAH